MPEIACSSENAKIIPVRTVGILLVCLLIHYIPGISDMLIYDRAAISDGELWRLVSSPMVHYDKAHLYYNLMAFGIAGWCVEFISPGYFTIVCLSNAILITLIMFIAMPEMNQYAGLSGIVCSLLVFYALHLFSESRWLSMAILMAISAKIVFELLNARSVLPYPNPSSFVIVPQSHLIGCLIAVIMFIFMKLKTN
ncbi:MAG: rhombosortase [Desulfobacteraceae bacterium]|nr:rhombosortase [Desulfobacteraceae bacterium]